MEMHTSHIYNGDQMLIIGGRAFFKSQNDLGTVDIIYSVDLKTGKVSEFGKLPNGIVAHVSCLVDNKYLVVYGGTNGYRFFDSFLRYDIAEKKWTLLTKTVPEMSAWCSEGRIASSCSQKDNDFALIFGGSSAADDHNNLLVLDFDLVRDSSNFSEITEIM